jgi:hypothetical protein
MISALMIWISWNFPRVLYYERDSKSAGFEISGCANEYDPRTH